MSKDLKHILEYAKSHQDAINVAKAATECAGFESAAVRAYREANSRFNEQNALYESIKPPPGLEGAMEMAAKLAPGFVSDLAVANVLNSSLMETLKLTNTFKHDHSALMQQAESMLGPIRQQYEGLMSACAAITEGYSPILLEYEAIQRSIGLTSKFSEMLQAKNLFGMAPEDFLERISPLHMEISELQKAVFNYEETDEESIEPIVASKTVPESINPWLDTIYKLACIANELIKAWVVLNAGHDINEATMRALENMVSIHASYQQTESGSQSVSVPSIVCIASVITTRASLRTGPSTENDVLRVMESGSRFTKTGQNGDWSSGFVSIGNEPPVAGWIYSTFLVPLPNGDSIEDCSK